MTDLELINGFSLDQRRRGLEPSTISQRRGRLRHFSGWLGGRGLLDATEDDVQRFLDGRRGRHGPEIDPRTRYAWLSHLHVFYVWARKTGVATHDPTLNISRPRLRRLLPRPIRDADLQMALELANRRKRAMLLLAAYAGFRCMEIAALDREDILDSYREPMLFVRGKGGKEATVPLHPDLDGALKSLPLPKYGPVFLNPKTKSRMTPAQVSIEMNSFLDGLGADATFHQLRHWFGTHVQETEGDLRVTQELMRHASPDTTAGYAAFSKKKAARAVRSLSVDQERPDPSDARLSSHDSGPGAA